MAKKKKTITVIVLLAVLALACGGYVGVLKYNEMQEEKAANQEDDTAISIITLEDVVAVSYDNETASLAFEKKDDQWVCTEQEDFPVIQSRINSIANAMKSMSANRQLDETEDLSQFGLDDPSMTVTATDSAGTTKTLKVGNVNEYTDDYYAMVDGDDTVYTISSGIVNYTDYTLEDLQQLDTIVSVASTQVNAVTIEKNGTQVVYEKREVTAAGSDEEATDTSAETETAAEEETESTETVWMKVTDAGEAQLTDEEVTALDSAIDAAGASAVDSCVNYKVEGDDRAQYGLDDASATVIQMDYVAAGESGTWNLQVGTLDESGEYYYVGVEDSAAVNLVEKASLDAILALAE